MRGTCSIALDHAQRGADGWPARDDGTAVLVVSDELDDLRRCDRVLVLFHGRVVAEHAAGWRDHELIASVEGVDHDG